MATKVSSIIYSIILSIAAIISLLPIGNYFFYNIHFGLVPLLALGLIFFVTIKFSKKLRLTTIIVIPITIVGILFFIFSALGFISFQTSISIINNALILIGFSLFLIELLIISNKLIKIIGLFMVVLGLINEVISIVFKINYNIFIGFPMLYQIANIIDKLFSIFILVFVIVYLIYLFKENEDIEVKNKEIEKDISNSIIINRKDTKVIEISDDIELLEKLFLLKEKGIITQEEFENKKKEILYKK